MLEALTTLSMPMKLGLGALALVVGTVAVRAFAKFAEAKREEQLQEDIVMRRWASAIAYLERKGRLEEIAEVEELRGELARAGEIYEELGKPEAAAGVYQRAGDWRMAAEMWARQERFTQAAELLSAYGEHGRASEMWAEAGELQLAAKEAGLAQAHRRAGDLWAEAGQVDAAVSAYQQAGERAKAAELLEAKGDKHGALRLRADDAVARGDHAAAAAAYQELGEVDRVVEALRAAGEIGDAARLMVERGELATAATWFKEAGEFGEAAALYARLGRYKDASKNAYRAGDVAKCIGYLSVLGDHLTMAKVYFQYGMRDEAKKVLRAVPTDAKVYPQALELLATRELEDENAREAYELFELLVSHTIARDEVGDEVRRWLRKQAEIMLQYGNVDRAVKHLEMIRDLNLLTPDISQKLRMLKPGRDKTLIEASASPGEVEQTLSDISQGLALPQHDRYAFKGILGQGGNGVVYLAEDRMLERELVIKMIQTESLPDEVARKWFLREAQTAARLNHPHIVTVYDMGEIEGQPFIAMEFVDGVTLARHAEGRLPLPERELKKLWSQLTDAVDSAHTQGIVHRDIKLENVMVTDQGLLKLMDFGLATALHGSMDTVVIAGTPRYMSPEQISGKGIDHQTDVYAMGVLFYKLATGRFPFENGNLLEAHRARKPPDPRRFAPNLPSGWAEAMLKALEKDKNRRYRSARAFADGLGVRYG